MRVKYAISKSILIRIQFEFKIDKETVTFTVELSNRIDIVPSTVLLALDRRPASSFGLIKETVKCNGVAVAKNRRSVVPGDVPCALRYQYLSIWIFWHAGEWTRPHA